MTSTQLRRCMKILRFLHSRGGSTTIDVYNEIFADTDYKSVELRQIQRDLRALEGEQLIESKKDGKEYCWSVRKEWRNVLPETYRGDQLLGLYVLKSYLTQFKGTKIGKSVNDLIKKIEGSASGDVFLLSVEHSVGRIDTSHLSDKIIQDSVEAIRTGKWVTVRYNNQSENSLKTYPVFPCRLFTFNGELYLISYNPKYLNYNALALRNIASIVALDSPPNGQDEVHIFDEQAFTRERFGVFADTPVLVRLLINREEAQFFTSRIWHPTQKFSTTETGDTILEMSVPLSPELTTWILGWKQYVRVLEPQTLIDSVLDDVDKIRQLYVKE